MCVVFFSLFATYDWAFMLQFFLRCKWIRCTYCGTMRKLEEMNISSNGEKKTWREEKKNMNSLRNLRFNLAATCFIVVRCHSRFVILDEFESESEWTRTHREETRFLRFDGIQFSVRYTYIHFVPLHRLLHPHTHQTVKWGERIVTPIVTF